MAGAQVEEVYAGIAGEHVQAMTSKGIVAVSDDEITDADVDRANEVRARAGHSAGPRAAPRDSAGVHGRARTGIRDPIGMIGTRLETEMYLVTIGSSPAINLRKSVERAGYKVRELVLEPLASALAVLTEDEKELGVALVEMGAGTTDLAVFHEGKIRHLGTIAFGGNNVTSDIVHGLGVTQADAERLKERYGCAYEPLVDRADMIAAAEHGGAGRSPDSARAAGAHHPPADGRDLRSRAARHPELGLPGQDSRRGSCSLAARRRCRAWLSWPRRVRHRGPCRGSAREHRWAERRRRSAALCHRGGPNAVRGQSICHWCRDAHHPRRRRRC